MRMRWCGVVAMAAFFLLAYPFGAVAQDAAGGGSVAAPAAASTAQVPQPPDGGVNWGGVGVGAASILANVLYIPAKLVYALTGGLFGGGAYLLTAGNSQVSDTIWRSSLGGDYVVTPAMLRGNEPVHFSGPTQTPSEGGSASAPTTAAAAPPSSAIAPVMPASPPSASSAAAAPSTSAGAAQPLDSGSGPVPIGRPASTIN